jgi:hypothetical protein
MSLPLEWTQAREQPSLLINIKLGMKSERLSDICPKRHLHEVGQREMALLATYPVLTYPLGRAHLAYSLSPSPRLVPFPLNSVSPACHEPLVAHDRQG